MDGLSGRPGNGPSTATAFSGSYMAGLMFQVTQPAMWFNGYYLWVCNTGQSTSPVQCALWNASSSSGGILVPNTTVTSGTLTAGQWNFIPLPTPVPIAIGTPYCTAISINGAFPDTTHQFGSGNTYVNGITNGPLLAYSDSGSGGSNPAPYTLHQMPFSTSFAVPTTAMPTVNNLNDNLWVDVQVSDTGPAGYAGSYRLWPNKLDSSPSSGLDTNLPFSLATEVRLDRPCSVSWIWFYSYPGATGGLPTTARVWRISGQAMMIANTSPSWVKPDGVTPAVQGGGWAKCAVSGVLPAGQYKVSYYNANGASGPWSPREYGYWLTGSGASGISWGPISSPAQGSANTAYVYQPNPASTPPYTDGSTQEPSNGTFSHDGDPYPYLAVDYHTSSGAPVGAIAENFWADLEVTPVPVSPFTQPPPVRGRPAARKGGCGGITTGAPRQPRPSPFRQPPPAKGLQAARTGSAHGSPGAPRQPFPSPFRQPAPVRGCPSARKGTTGGITTGSPRLPRPSPFRQPPPGKGLQAARPGRWAGPTGGAPRTPPVPSPFRQPGPVRGAMSATRGRHKGSPGAPVFALRPILLSLGRSRLPWALGHARNR